MRRIIALVALVGSLVGGGWFFTKYRVEGLEEVILRPRNGSEPSFGGATGDGQADPRQTRDPNTIRIASFNIQVFGPSKSAKLRVMDILSQIVRRFDIVAIQEIRSKDQTLIPRFISQINANGAQYEFVLGPRLGRTHSKEQYAYLFDSQTIEIDRNATYTLIDTHDRMHREPLVALFRTRAISPDESFTFKLVNVHTDPDDVEEEMNAMDDVYRAVVSDGDGEDDVILLGDFNTSADKLYQLGQVSGLTTALAGVPTNTRRTKEYDNLIFHQRSTNEFLGRAGVLDIVRAFNLTTDEAIDVSDHLPVWGEFSVYEGGQAGSVAALPDDSTTVPR